MHSSSFLEFRKKKEKVFEKKKKRNKKVKSKKMKPHQMGAIATKYLLGPTQPLD